MVIFIMIDLMSHLFSLSKSKLTCTRCHLMTRNSISVILVLPSIAPRLFKVIKGLLLSSHLKRVLSSAVCTAIFLRSKPRCPP